MKPGPAVVAGSFAGIVGVTGVGFIVEKTGSYNLVFQLTTGEEATRAGLLVSCLAPDAIHSWPCRKLVGVLRLEGGRCAACRALHLWHNILEFLLPRRRDLRVTSQAASHHSCLVLLQQFGYSWNHPQQFKYICVVLSTHWIDLQQCWHPLSQL